MFKKEKTSLDKIYELEDFDLAISKQKIIDFITNFIPFWRNFFRQKNFQTNIEVYNKNIEQIISQISQYLTLLKILSSMDLQQFMPKYNNKFKCKMINLYGIDHFFYSTI